MLNKLRTILRSDLFLYLIVGALATIVEWSGFWIFFDMLRIQYLLATALAFVFSTFANWLLGRILVFRGKQNQSLLKELLSIYLTSIGGLLLNLGIMYVMVDFCSIQEMIAKITATVLVFSYNYLIRKKLIYKK
jgi:dolichol-phosphate mannosyltransferase